MMFQTSVLLLSLFANERTSAASTARSGADDVAILVPLPLPASYGQGARSGDDSGGIEWPDEVKPLATLDGPAIIAANAALQRLLASFPKEYATDCSYSAKAMDVTVGQERGLYFVEIKRRLERCGWAAPGFEPAIHWFELYAVSPEGKVLARYPYHP